MSKVQLEGSWVYQGVLYSPDENGEAEMPKEAQDAIKAKGGVLKEVKQARAQKQDDKQDSE